MSRRWLVAAAAALAGLVAATLSGTPAGAQIQLGGQVQSLIALSVGMPTGFARLPGSAAYSLRLPVKVTSTGATARLSIADGEDLSAPARGHLRIGGRLAAAPLEAAVGPGLQQPLSGPVDPVLMTWHQSLTLAPATIVIQQSLPHGSIGTQRVAKTVLITVSSQTP